MKHLFAIAFSAIALGAFSQQTIFESNLLSKAKVRTDGVNVDNLSYLTDMNANTISILERSGDTMALIYTFDDPVFVTGINIVSGYDTSLAPYRVYVYGRNTTDEDWSNVARLMTVSFSQPNTNYCSKTMSSSKSFKEYKVEINAVRNGGMKAEIAEIQFVGRDNNLPVISTAANGKYSIASGDIDYGYGQSVTVSKNSNDIGVIGENAWSAWLQYDFDTPISIAGYTLGGGATGVRNKRPAVWELLGSNDGVNWVSLDMQTNAPDVEAEQFALEYGIGKSAVNIDFGAEADKIYDMIQEKFWRSYGGGNYLIHAWSSNPDKINTGYNYWWMAHAIDAYTDAFRRSGNLSYETRARQIRQSMYYGYFPGRNDLWTDYIDDMEWMLLACIRASQTMKIAPNVWLREAKDLYDMIYQDGFNKELGAVRWTVNSDWNNLGSYNSCANGPYMTAAAMLYNLTGEEDYLETAKTIYKFMKENNLFEDGFVKDGPKENSRGWAFTYNQGTWVGGLLELYKATGEKTYYDTAVDLIDKSIDSRWYSPKGIMCESGKSDGGLFKGIYVRYITEWVLSGLLDENRQTRYANYLLENARSLYLAALLKPEMTIMANWQDRNEANLDDYHASVVLSGLFLFESVDRMRQAGILNEDYSLKLPYEETAFKYYRLVVSENFGGNNVEIASFALLGEEGQAGLEEVYFENKNPDSNWFSISGIPVKEPTVPGIYIHNGKKVPIK